MHLNGLFAPTRMDLNASINAIDQYFRIRH